jgi:hypothetical protein
MAIAASEAACRAFNERDDFIQGLGGAEGSPQTLNRDMLVKLIFCPRKTSLSTGFQIRLYKPRDRGQEFDPFKVLGLRRLSEGCAKKLVGARAMTPRPDRASWRVPPALDTVRESRQENVATVQGLYAAPSCQDAGRQPRSAGRSPYVGQGSRPSFCQSSPDGRLSCRGRKGGKSLPRGSNHSVSGCDGGFARPPARQGAALPQHGEGATPRVDSRSYEPRRAPSAAVSTLPCDTAKR